MKINIFFLIDVWKLGSLLYADLIKNELKVDLLVKQKCLSGFRIQGVFSSRGSNHRLKRLRL